MQEVQVSVPDTGGYTNPAPAGDDRSGEEREEMKLNLKTLAEFIVNAKRKSWAGDAKETAEFGVRKVAPFISHFKKFDLCYSDQYVSGKKDLNYYGLEAVCISIDRERTDWIPIWAMSYSEDYYGTDKEKEKFNDVLKQALKLVSADAPFRGPKYYDPKSVVHHGMPLASRSNYYYQNIWDGDIKWFTGNEFIKRRHPPKKVHSLTYNGGLIK